MCWVDGWDTLSCMKSTPDLGMLTIEALELTSRLHLAEVCSYVEEVEVVLKLAAEVW